MADNPQVKVQLTLDSRQYEQAAKSASKHTAAVDKSMKDTQRTSAKTALSWAAMGTAITVMGAKAAAGIKQAIDAASDLNESTSKMRVVFGRASADIVKFAESSADALGMTKQQAYDAASMMATFGKAAGLTGQDLARFSTDMVSLSADLGSFFNTDSADAMEAIGAALRGESEPIRRYGVLLDDATLRARAFEMGLISSVRNGLTPQQKALAAQAEILAQTSDAQGDFARTGDGLANSQKKLAAELGNLKAEVGESLLPLFTKGVQGATALAEAFGALPGPVKDGVAIIAAGLAALAITGPAIAGAIKGVRAVSDGLKAYQGAAAGASVATDGLTAASNRLAAGALVKTLGIIGAGVAALVVIVNKAGDQIEDLANRRVNGMVEALKAGAAAGQEFGARLQITFGGGEVATGIDEIAAAVGRSSLKAKEAAPAFQAMDQYLASLPADQAKAGHDELAAAFERNGKSVQDLNAMLPTYIAGVKGAAQAGGEQAAAEQEKADAIKKANDAQQAALDLLTGYINAQMAAAGAADALLGAQDRLTKAHKESGDALKGTSAKAVENREALRSEMGMVLANANAKVEQAKAAGATTVEAYEIGNKAIAKGRKALVEAAESAGYNKAEVRKLLDQYMALPGDVETKIKATGVQSAEDDVAAYKRLIDRVPATVRTQFIAQYTKVKNASEGYASGGKVVGPGTGTSDTAGIYALSNGEWVVPAAVAGRLGDGFMTALVAGEVGAMATGGKVMTPKQRAAAAAKRKRDAAARRKKAADAAAQRRADIIDDIGWQYDMGLIDQGAYIGKLQGEQGKVAQGSEEWKDLALTIKRAQDDAAATQQEAADDAARAQVDAAEEAARAQQEAADAAAKAQQDIIDAQHKAYTDSMRTFDHWVTMGAEGYRTAAEQLEQLSKVTATSVEDQWALDEKRHALQMQIAAEQEAAAKAAQEAAEAAAKAAEDAKQAARDQRDQYASGIAQGVIGALGLGQADGNGKRWTVGRMLGDFANRARTATDFSGMVQTLTGRGLSEDIIGQVLAAGPEAGADMARTLSRMTDEQIKQVNASQSTIAGAGVGLGSYLANRSYAVAGDMTMKIELGGAAPVVLQLDSRQIYEGQLQLKRQMGGTYALVPA